MSRRLSPILALLLVAVSLGLAFSGEPDEAGLRKAVTFYASFDEAVKADFGGSLTLSTRFNHPTEKGKFVVEKGFDEKVFRIARDRGKHGGCLEVVDVLPRNGRIFFPVKGNLAYRKDGWGGSLSVWINTDPDTLLKTKFCDPIQITEKGANNGGIWFDFNDARPRDMRLGVFSAVAEGQQGIKEDDPRAPMVWVKKVGFKSGDWRHIVLTWENLDTGKKDAQAVLWIDGKKIGSVTDHELAMKWDEDKAGIYVAVNYIGFLDELALFNRPLNEAEIGLLRNKPGVLSALKGKSAP
jgi:Concanavalin A-like lectin/glucanases superfamily